MAKSVRKKPSAAQQALYAPKPKPPVARPSPKVAEKHAVSDEMLRKIIQHALSELKVPGNIPSEVIFTALAEVRSLVERALVGAGSDGTPRTADPTSPKVGRR